MVDGNLLDAIVRERTEELCRHFFPKGKKVGHEWKLGDVSGAPGDSLGIELIGPKAGLWHDRSTGQGGTLVNLIATSRSLTFPQAVEEMGRTLGINLHGDSLPNDSSYYLEARQEQKPKREPLKLDGIHPCTKADLNQIARLRKISVRGLKIADERKLLFTHEHPYQGRCWLITDDARRNAIYRRLDGKRFHFRQSTPDKKEGPKSCCWTDAEANWPIGIMQAADYPAIALCEGAPDFLAAFHLAWAGGVEQLVAPVCMTGASCRIHEDALPLFRGKRVRIFGHADDKCQGQAAVLHWASQLQEVQAEVDCFSFKGLVTADNLPVNDLNDFIGTDERRSGCGIEVTTSPFDFGFERRNVNGLWS
jgi:hypothetical protein